MRTLIAYVPVLHEGYRQFFERHEGPKELYIFGSELIEDFPWLAKEIRELDPGRMKKAIESLGIFDAVHVLKKEDLAQLNERGSEIILPNEDVSRMLAEKYLQVANVVFENIFLRWDKHNSVAENSVEPDKKISRSEFDRKVMGLAEKDSERSSDIWRHVGAAIVKDGEIILIGHNEHKPSEHSPYVSGDPRNNFHKGNHIEISTAFHAEASLIAESARRGISLEGAKLYVTVFPCPPCAKLIAYSGIDTIYYASGYSVLDGEAVLKGKGIELIFVG